MRRPDDWMRQADLDLEAARHAATGEHFEWACFLAQQAAEKAAKAAHQSEGVEAWGHSVTQLLTELEGASAEALDAARRLDKHYIGARYPNSHPAGAPGDLYTRPEAEQAFADAATVIEDVRRRVSST